MNLFKKLQLELNLLKKFLKEEIESNIPAEIHIRLKWWKKFGYPLNLDEPKTYNEKIQWHKLNAFNKLATICADKLLLRNYVKENIGEGYTIPILGVYSSVEEIPFKELPKDFVLKANHDSGSVLIVKNGNINFYKLKEIKYRMKINFGKLTKEWVYENIKPKILIEELISSNGDIPRDYKVFCFNGEPKLIQVDLDRFTNHKRDFYDIKWRKLDLAILYPNSNYYIPPPDKLEEMLFIASKLSYPFNHARVDFFAVNKKLYVTEITFFHGSGFEPFNKKEWEFRLGEWYNVSRNLSNTEKVKNESTNI